MEEVPTHLKIGTPTDTVRTAKYVTMLMMLILALRALILEPMMLIFAPMLILAPMMLMVTQHIPTRHIPTRWEYDIMNRGGNVTLSYSHHIYIHHYIGMYG